MGTVMRKPARSIDLRAIRVEWARAWATASFFWRLLGTPLATAIVLMAGALLGLFVAWQAMHANAALGARLATLTRESAGIHRGNSPRAHSVQVDLDQVIQQFPGRDGLSTEVEHLYSLADASGIRLETGDYQASVDNAAGILRYAITLPVKGRAASVVSFVLRAMNDSPTLVLQSISFKREESDSAGSAQPAGIPLPTIPSPGETSPAPSAMRPVVLSSDQIPPSTAELQPPLPLQPQPGRSTGATMPAGVEARVRFVYLVRVQ